MNNLIAELSKMEEIIIFDKEIANGNFGIGKSKLLKNNISNYLCLISIPNLDLLTEEEKNIFAKGEYKELLQKTLTIPNRETILYGVAVPEHFVPNGSLVLEFVYGKNTVNVPDDKYYQFVKAQREYIYNCIDKLKKQLKSKLNINVEIFIDKRG